jgi:outer membrane protein TolC
MFRHFLHATCGALGRTRLFALLLIAPAALAAQQAQAAPRATPRTALTLADVVERLERTNPMLAASRAAAQAARARIGPATALPDPRAQLAVMNRMLPNLSTMSVLAMDQLTVMQMLPLATRRPAARAAEARARTAESGIDAQRFAVRRDAASMLADWWQADAARGVMDETRTLLRESAAAADAMYGAGQARQADVLRAQAELTRMTAEWLTMDGMRRTAAAGLSAMLDEPLDADALHPELPAGPAAPMAVSSTVASPDVVTAHHSVDAAIAMEAVARRERWPELDVGLQLGRRPGSSEQMVSLMAGASIPIFARQRQLQMIEESSAMRRMVEAEARSAMAENRAGVSEALSALERSRTLQRLYATTLLPQLHAVLESANSAYRAGTGPIDVALDALMAENVARIAHITARADEARALARIERLTGRAWFGVPLMPERHP